MFSIALSNVIVTLLYIFPGFIICKMKKATAAHLSTMSAVLIYVCSPCMIVSAFLALELSAQNLMNMAMFFFASLVLQALFMALLYLIFRRRSNESKYRLLTVGSVLGNVGFFGLPIVKALLPNNPEVLCYSIVYAVSMNILVFTVGVFCLTGKKESMTLKAGVFNPAMFGFVIGLGLYLFRAGTFIPELLSDSIDLLGKMTTPLCMLILGIRLATVDIVKLFTRPMIYLTCFGKLVMFPLFAYFAVCFLPLDFAFKAAMMILSSTPCASVLLNIAEMHHGETELAANSVLVSTLLCFLTIPLLTQIL